MDTCKKKATKGKAKPKAVSKAKAKPKTRKTKAKAKAKAKPKPVSKAKAKPKTKSKLVLTAGEQQLLSKALKTEAKVRGCSVDAVRKIWKHCQGAKEQK